jgi:hypothetical protein
MANRNFPSSKLYTGHVMPVLLDCNFIVDSTNGNGLGIRSLKGPYISNVYMNTSATPAVGNPNPQAGVIVVQLTDNFNRYYGGASGQVSPVGASVTATTINVAYVITSLGTATLAEWQAVGVPTNLVPAVGLAFIATASATIGGSATVAPSSASGSGIDHIEVLGDANQSIAPINGTNGQIILQCFSEGVITAPANGSVISLQIYLSNSSIQIAGE